MGACTKLSYSNVTSAAWNCVVKFAASHGVHVKSDKGKASKDGFTVAWDYNPTAKTASVQCVSSPFFVPCSVIDNYINSHAHDCLKANEVVMESMIAD